MNKMSGIYRLKNKINGKEYFGQSINLEKRKNDYFIYGDFPNDHLKNSFNKYGKENFEFQIIKCCKEKYLDRFEKLYIRINDTMNRDKGYNKESGGNLHRYYSKESRRKISESMKGENNHKYRDDLDTNIFIDEYFNKGLSTDDIAKKHNCSNETVWQRLKKAGCDLRGRGHPNTTGYYRVTTDKDSHCKQGFLYVYQYYEDGKQKKIRSVNINKLEVKVREKGLTWRKL